MVKNTALRAESNKKQEVLFKDKEHKNFYNSSLSKIRYLEYCHNDNEGDSILC